MPEDETTHAIDKREVNALNSVNISSHWGIIILRDALQRENISIDRLSALMEAEEPLGVNDSMISFGPHFGSEASDTFMKRLEEAGLIYFDDFFEFSGSFPDWCQFKVDTID